MSLTIEQERAQINQEWAKLNAERAEFEVARKSSSVGEVKLSNGRLLTWINWRANRQVDAPSKRTATEHQPPLAIGAILGWAKPAAGKGHPRCHSP